MRRIGAAGLGGAIGAAGVGGATSPAALARAGRGGSGFTARLDLAPGPDRAEAMAAAGAVGTIGLFALQEDVRPEQRDAAARWRGDRLALELRGLQLELLGGACDPGRLTRLAELRLGEAAADPALAEAVAALALRAEIELVRRGWDGSAAVF